VSFVQLAEQKKQKVSEIKAGLDDAEALVICKALAATCFCLFLKYFGL